jgi:hypothetical protein
MTIYDCPVSCRNNDSEVRMHGIDDKTKLIFVRTFFILNGIFLFFWWPLSHWLYPDLYHHLLGFRDGSYPDAMVKIIGTCGCIPVMLLLLSAVNPLRNRDSVIAIIIFAVLIGSTYVFLITRGDFPIREYINVALSFFSAIFLILFYPWKSAKRR